MGVPSGAQSCEWRSINDLSDLMDVVMKPSKHRGALFEHVLRNIEGGAKRGWCVLVLYNLKLNCSAV